MEDNRELQPNKTSLLSLFLTFFKIGAFTFGGGLAMISIMMEEAVKKRKWVTDEEILDMVVIAESTPGVFAVNTATYVGYKVRKFWGSVVATLGAVLPSFIIICIISLLLNQFQENVIINNFLLGIKAGVVVLVLKASFTLFKSCEKTAFTIPIMLISLLVSVFFDVSVLICLGCGAILGIIKGLFFKKKKEDIMEEGGQDE